MYISADDQGLVLLESQAWIFCSRILVGVVSPWGPEEVAARSGAISLKQFFSQLTAEETKSLHFKTEVKLSLPSNKLWIWIPRQRIGKPSDRGDKDDYPFVSKRDLSNPTRQGYPLRKVFCFLFLLLFLPMT